jgi:tyrosine-protein phosphatase YwqE
MSSAHPSGHSRYLLLEPPHYAPLPQLEEYVFKLHAAGYIGILTHPERLAWVETQYRLIERMVHNGVWVQLTAGSLRAALDAGLAIGQSACLMKDCVTSSPRIGAEYFRSAVEYFVANEMITFLRSDEHASALKAAMLTGTASGIG